MYAIRSYYAPLMVLFFIVIVNVIFTPNFASVNTLRNLAIQVTSSLLVALGMTWVIASGGIDISVGSVMALVSMVSAKLVGIGAVQSITIGIITGILSSYNFV